MAVPTNLMTIFEPYLQEMEQTHAYLKAKLSENSPQALNPNFQNELVKIHSIYKTIIATNLSFGFIGLTINQISKK